MKQRASIRIDLQTIERFVGNLDLIFAEEEFQSAGNATEVYFDTADVRDAALGMRAYYQNNVFVPRQFDEPRALVQALAARGDLGPFQLLSAHQAEFLALMSIDFGLHSDPDLDDFASKFWQDVGIIDKAVSLRTLTPEEIRHIVKLQVGRAAAYFKAVEAIRGDWRWRLKQWRRNGIMFISSVPEPYADLIASDRFMPLKEVFDKRREKLSDNNFADAVALVALMEKVEAFNRGEANRRKLPLFYAPMPQFARLLRAVGFEELVKVQLPSGQRTTVLRDTDFFVLRAIVRASNRAAAEGGNEVLFTRDELHAIHREMREILDAHKTLPADESATVSRSERTPMDTLIRSVTELSFFDNIWLPFRAEADTQQALGQVGATETMLTRQAAQADLKVVVGEVRSEMRANSDRFRTVRTLWRDLPGRYYRQRRFLSDHLELESPMLLRTGLVRFSLPGPIHGRIRSIMADILSTSKTLERTALSSAVATTLSALDHPEKEADAEVAAAVLWVAEFDTEILRLLRPQPERRTRHYSLDLLYAAACVRSGSDINSALNTYVDLEKRRSSEPNTRARADMSMGLAYLYYHLWNRARNNPVTADAASRRLQMDLSAIIREAVSKAKEAYDLVPDIEKEQIKRVYLLNQIVYFMTLSGQFDWREIEDLANKLAEYTEHRRDLWQYRYDDTLARYYLLVAQSIDDPESCWTYLMLADSRTESAQAEAPGDEEVRTTYELVKKHLVQGRAKRGRATA